MLLLRMREACFTASGAPVGPLTLEVRRGERAARVFASVREATIAARMAAAIVKATSGSVLLEEYDPRVQPARCKRIVAFVPHMAMPIDEPSLERYTAYRAALWGIDPVRAVAHAKLLMERLDGMHEAFAYPLIGALIGDPKIVVFDRPQPAYAAQILSACGARATFTTQLSNAAAAPFGNDATAFASATEAFV